MRDDVIKWILQWYSEHCDGDWEHQHGIDIGTLDNPGWKLCIDLTETELEDVSFAPVKIQRADDDWVFCRLEENEGKKQFRGYGGLFNLPELLTVFRSWASASERGEQ